MKIVYQSLVFFICLNLAFTVVNEVMLLCGLPVWLNPQVSPEEMSDAFNPQEAVGGWTSWVSTVLYVGDVVGGLLGMFNHVINFFVGFPVFLNSMGAPPVIVSVLAGLNGFIWCVWIWQWIGGRRMDQ